MAELINNNSKKANREIFRVNLTIKLKTYKSIRCFIRIFSETDRFPVL